MRLSGELTMATTPALLQQAGALIADGEVDLSAVSNADSAGAAFLLELKRRAARSGKPLRFSHCPPQLGGLIAFFGLEEALSMRESVA